MLLMLRLLSLLALALTPLHMATASPVPAAQPAMAAAMHHARDDGPAAISMAECCGDQTSQHGFCQMPAALPVALPPPPRATIRAGDMPPRCQAQQHGRSPPPDLRPPIRA